MHVLNDWLQTNIQERLTNPDLDFDAWFRKTPFYEDTFDTAFDEAANAIGNFDNKVVVPLSGGADSSFVIECLHANGVKVTPYMVQITGNYAQSVEMKYGLDLCERLGLDPIIVKVTEMDHLRYYLQHIFVRLGGVGVYNVPALMAAEFAIKQDAVLVGCDHLLDTAAGKVILRFNEYDFYQSASGCKFVPFFFYSPELVHAMFKALPENYADVSEAKLKSLLFRRLEQPVIPTRYTNQKVAAVYQAAARSVSAVKHTFSAGTRDSLIAVLDGWKL